MYKDVRGIDLEIKNIRILMHFYRNKEKIYCFVSAVLPILSMNKHKIISFFFDFKDTRKDVLTYKYFPRVYVFYVLCVGMQL